MKPLKLVSALAAVLTGQLLYFWLIPVSSDYFRITYPFYTALMVIHIGLMVYLGTRYKYPATFAPGLIGGIVTIGEMVATFLITYFTLTMRSALFIQGIICAFYIVVMAFFISIAKKESVNSSEKVQAVKPYRAPSVQKSSTPVSSAQARLPRVAKK